MTLKMDKLLEMGLIHIRLRGELRQAGKPHPVEKGVALLEAEGVLLKEANLMKELSLYLSGRLGWKDQEGGRVCLAC